MNQFTFCLGLHQTKWMRVSGLFPADATLFYSFNAASGAAQYWPASYRTRWDSGGFTRLQLEGNWDRWPVDTYVPRVRAICRGVGTVDGFAIQDWMCEPQVIHGKVERLIKQPKRPPQIDPAHWMQWARNAGPALAETVRHAEELGPGNVKVVFHGTGLSVEEHQHRTVSSYLTLTKMAPEVPWFPVLQGWTRTQYLDCWDMYERAGVELRSLPLVAVGSTCRRHDTQEVEDLVKELHRRGLRNLHMLGMKTDGLRNCVQYVRSSDSMAWSYGAWKQHIVLPGCQHGTKKWQPKLGREEFGNCANCARYACHWYEEQLAIINEALGPTGPRWLPPSAWQQLPLFMEAA